MNEAREHHDDRTDGLTADEAEELFDRLDSWYTERSR